MEIREGGAPFPFRFVEPDESDFMQFLEGRFDPVDAGVGIENEIVGVHVDGVRFDAAFRVGVRKRVDVHEFREVVWQTIELLGPAKRVADHATVGH